MTLISVLQLASTYLTWREATRLRLGKRRLHNRLCPAKATAVLIKMVPLAGLCDVYGPTVVVMLCNRLRLRRSACSRLGRCLGFFLIGLRCGGTAALRLAIDGLRRGVIGTLSRGVRRGRCGGLRLFSSSVLFLRR